MINVLKIIPVLFFVNSLYIWPEDGVFHQNKNPRVLPSSVELGRDATQDTDR